MVGSGVCRSMYIYVCVKLFSCCVFPRDFFPMGFPAGGLRPCPPKYFSFIWPQLIFVVVVVIDVMVICVCCG